MKLPMRHDPNMHMLALRYPVATSALMSHMMHRGKAFAFSMTGNHALARQAARHARESWKTAEQIIRHAKEIGA